MGKEEPIMVRYVSLTEKGRKLFDALLKVVEETETVEKQE
ncbi:unnamed protein product [marine sediment metagenome]|uniref:Winged helix DNA-binding domain-containing protein n=1 Tax=marine sediment metagenome TaxID=412755 RepID=X1KTS1_9ZZZZ